MKTSYIQAIGAIAITALVGFATVWLFNKATTVNETHTPQCDSLSVDTCKAPPTDTTQIYVYETDSCCSH